MLEMLVNVNCCCVNMFDHIMLWTLNDSILDLNCIVNVMVDVVKIKCMNLV